MPVEFERHDPDRGRIDLSEGTNAHTILSFLAARPDLGFTPKEIHEGTGVPRGSVGTTLSRLESHGLVRHRGEYWAIEEDDRVASVVGTALSMEATESDDWYTANPDWADDLPDLDAE